MNQKAAKQIILVVDDIPDNIEVLRGALLSDYTVVAALNGEKALQLVRGEHRPDIILLDIMMPGMDGYEVCRQLKSDPDTSQIPVIFVTAKTEVEDEKLGFELGAVDYITKPVSPPIVQARVCTQLALYNQNRELAQLNQEKNRFLGMAAHDLRNPLTALVGYTELLLKGFLGELNDKQKDCLNDITQSSQTMRNLMDDLLDVTKIESGTLELNHDDTDIRSLVLRILSLFEPQAVNKNITIKCAIDDDIPENIKLDLNKIEQVINNLISNAIKYSPAETQVDVHVYTENNRLFTEVKDQGVGIPQDELGNIFKPFQITSSRTTAGEKSTGLGLAIVHRIVSGHGGEIKVSSEARKGTTFLVELPMRT